MSIQKKSLISTLKSAKKANITKDEVSFDHSRNSTKAQPVLKLTAKFKTAAKLAQKAAAKASAKAVSKASAKAVAKF